MNKHKTLRAGQLRASLPAERIPFTSSEEIPRSAQLPAPQPRALEALKLALHIKDMGYNVYLAGEPNLGRTYMLKDFLRPWAKKAPTPPDLVYMHNFADSDVPRLLRLPAGQGAKFKAALNKALSRIRKELPGCLERESYTLRRSTLLGSLQTRKSSIFKRMDQVAGTHGFNLDVDDSGAMTLYPLVGGKRLSEQEFEKLEASERNGLKLKGDVLAQTMSGFLRKIGRAERDFLAGERSLEKEVAAELLNAVLDPVAKKFHAICKEALPECLFPDMKADILENLDYFLPSEAPAPEGAPYPPSLGHEPLHYEDISHRYDVNLFVDNGSQEGAPIIMDDHPTPGNLLGCIEREAEMGALVTNFTLIKAGSLHRANGGFLILHMEDIIPYPQAWEGLLRALRGGSARIEDSGESEGVKTKGIRPEPLALSLKVILVGDEDMHEALLFNDDRFSKLFKIKAHMTGHMPRNARGIGTYLRYIRRIIDEAALLPFTREALAGLVDFGSALIEDQQKLSLELPFLRELMVEASAHAAMGGGKEVTMEHLRQAKKAGEFRVNLVEEAFMEEYDRKLIKVSTSGEAVGRVNGLSVTMYGDFEFGLPHQISCTVGVGQGGVVDLEREAQLGGPIHTKAIMILKSYLVDRFARKKPLIFTGSLYFEQSYAGVEGDSASGAELAALLSAIAQVPVRQNLAFTGAVSQSGQIMAVGSVTRKIEGFFEVCRRHGLSGDQGVLIPKDNLDQLMLNDQVIQAVEQGRFHIYPVSHITAAMEILTGLPSGNLRGDNSFTPGSLYHKVDRRLAELTKIAIKALKN